MKCKSSLFVFLIACFAAYSQDTVRIRNLNKYQEGKINILVSPSGKQTFISLLDKSQGWAEDDSLEDADVSGAVMLSTKSSVDPNITDEQKRRIKENECINNRFAGLSRSKVKTTITQKSPRSYISLSQFVNTLFADKDMKVVVKALTKPYADRAIQEDKMVTVKNVFLLAYAREKDNDYHLILTNANRSIFFNAELSGLPGNSANSYQTLKAVRSSFENFPGGTKCGKYTFLATPLKILSIKGSLFFDIDHSAGQVGPEGFRPATAWEIHPVTEIKFE